jgi:hypothetical protein
LQGQKYVDRSRDIAYSEALRSVIIALGCNHNFFNTEWTPGLAVAPTWDDWEDTDDPTCGIGVAGSIRLTPQEQQVVGAAYIIALIRMSVYQDSAMLSLLDGSYVRPESIGRAEVSTHAVGGAANRLLYRPEDQGGVTGIGGMVAMECLGFGASTMLPACHEFLSKIFGPHWLFDEQLPPPVYVSLRWSRRIGAAAVFTIPVGLQDLSSLDNLDVRIMENSYSTAAAEMKIIIQDSLSRNATLNTSRTTIDSWPSSYDLFRMHARTLRGYLATAQNVDLKNIVKIILVAKSRSGDVVVLDIAASQAKIKKPINLDLPVVSLLEMMNVTERDGVQAAEINVQMDKPLQAPGTIWMKCSMSWWDERRFPINLTVGSTTVKLPITVVGDDVYSFYTYPISMRIGALTGVLTGNIQGVFQVIDDEPAPTIRFQKQVNTTEGNSLIWKFRLSGPSTGWQLLCEVIPPRKGTELSSNDVPHAWIHSFDRLAPIDATPLSKLRLFTKVEIGYGMTETSLVVPIAMDSVHEDTEQMMWACSYFGWRRRAILHGIVRA